MEFIKYILSQTPRVLMGISLFCILVLLISSEILSKISLLELRNEYNSFIWVALFLSLSLLISHFLFDLFPTVKNLITQISNARKQRRYLHSLSSEEKEILQNYFKKDTRTAHFSMFSGAHRGLETFGILYQSSDITIPGRDTFDYNIVPWAWDYLKKHPELISASIANNKLQRAGR